MKRRVSEMPWYSVVMIIVGVVCILFALLMSDEASRLSTRCGIIGGLLIGGFFFGHYMVRVNAGQPITEFHDGDIYKVVAFDQIVDNQSMAVVGLRKERDGRSVDMADDPHDARLRMYFIPNELNVSEKLSDRKIRPPFYIRFVKTGDFGSFIAYRKNPHVEKKVQPAK